MSVAVGPGWTSMTAIFFSAKSRARPCTSRATAAFVIPYSCARDERAARRVAADNDHLAAGRQMTSGSLRCDKHAPYVDRDHLVKVGKRVVGYVPVDQDARVVHEDIQPV